MFSEIDVVPDEQSDIEERLKYYADVAHINLVISTGGTGMRFCPPPPLFFASELNVFCSSPRDVTPEATRAVIEREAPGVVIAMISCFVSSPSSILSLPHFSPSIFGNKTALHAEPTGGWNQKKNTDHQPAWQPPSHCRRFLLVDLANLFAHSFI